VVEYNSEVRQVADTNFDANAAATACTELYGFPEVMLFRGGEACEIDTGFWIDNIRCEAN